jgi:hypothetical protein
MSERYIFSQPRGERFKFNRDKFVDAWEVGKQYGADVLVHPTIAKAAEEFWLEQTHQLRFENPTRTWDQCSREVARRNPFVYLSRGRIPESDQVSYDIDIKEVK